MKSTVYTKGQLEKFNLRTLDAIAEENGIEYDLVFGTDTPKKADVIEAILNEQSKIEVIFGEFIFEGKDAEIQKVQHREKFDTLEEAYDGAEELISNGSYTSYLIPSEFTGRITYAEGGLII